MSIATDEALKAENSILESELNGTSWLIGFERGYIAGRTAYPTKAEIEAADKALLQAYRDNSNMLSNRESVHIVLDAARKAVTE